MKVGIQTQRKFVIELDEAEASVLVSLLGLVSVGGVVGGVVSDLYEQLRDGGKGAELCYTMFETPDSRCIGVTAIGEEFFKEKQNGKS